MKKNKPIFPYLISQMVLKGENREDLAKVVNLSTSAVNRRLSGDVEWNLSEIKKISKHYGKSVEELFLGDL